MYNIFTRKVAEPTKTEEKLTRYELFEKALFCLDGKKRDPATSPWSFQLKCIRPALYFGTRLSKSGRVYHYWCSNTASRRLTGARDTLEKSFQTSAKTYVKASDVFVNSFNVACERFLYSSRSKPLIWHSTTRVICTPMSN